MDLKKTLDWKKLYAKAIIKEQPANGVQSSDKQMAGQVTGGAVQ